MSQGDLWGRAFLAQRIAGAKALRSVLCLRNIGKAMELKPGGEMEKAR